MSKIQDLRNPKRTILSRLPSRTATFDRLVDGYAKVPSLILYSIIAVGFSVVTMMLYGFLRALVVGLPTLLMLFIKIPYAISRIPLIDILGISATGVFLFVISAVHFAYLARSASPEIRGRRILTADQALRSATKQSTNPASGKSKIRPQP